MFALCVFCCFVVVVLVLWWGFGFVFFFYLVGFLWVMCLFVLLHLVFIRKSAFGTHLGCERVGLINKCQFLSRQLQNVGVFL